MVHYLVLSCQSAVRLSLLLGSCSGLGLCSSFRKLPAWLLFSDDDDDDDGDSIFFRNVGISVPGCTAAYSRRPALYICSCKNLKSRIFNKQM
jgi:hypothetical protein